MEAPRLSPRQSQIVTLIAKGLRNREIAAVLGVTPRTVVWHVSESLRKSGTHSRAQLVMWRFGTKAPASSK